MEEGIKHRPQGPINSHQPTTPCKCGERYQTQTSGPHKLSLKTTTCKRTQYCGGRYKTQTSGSNKLSLSHHPLDEDTMYTVEVGIENRHQGSINYHQATTPCKRTLQYGGRYQTQTSGTNKLSLSHHPLDKDTTL